MKSVETDEYHKYPEGSKVRLKKSRADVYKMAHAGSEGFIRHRGLDVGDFPMIWIEWDKNTWNYNGEQDMWTFEDHFEPIEEEKTVSEEKLTPEQAMAKMAEIFALMGVAEPKVKEETKEEQKPQLKKVESHDFSPPVAKDMEEYMQELTDGLDAASEGEGFILIAIKAVPRMDGSEEKFLIPETFVKFNSEPAGYTLQLAVSAVHDIFHNEAVARIISENFTKKDK